jgi:hypothetical protein
MRDDQVNKMLEILGEISTDLKAIKIAVVAVGIFSYSNERQPPKQDALDRLLSIARKLEMAQ